MGQEVKNPLRAQSKYGLMGSSAKPGKFSFWGSPEHFLHKNAIWDRTPPPLTDEIQSTCVWEGSRVPNLQMEFNYLDSFKSYGIFRNFVVPMVPMLSPWSPCHPHHPHIVPIAPKMSPCCPHGCGLRGLHPMLSTLSPWYPHRPHHPHVDLASPCHPNSI